MGTSQTVLVTVNPLPVVNFSGIINNVCFNSAPQTLSGTPSGAGGVFSISGGNGITGNIYSPAIAGAGTHGITYTYTDANLCSNSTTQNATVLALPVTPNICLISVDSVSLYNQIIWEKPAGNDKIESYYIYRDTANNAYGLIGIVPADSLSFVEDTARHLCSKSFKFRIVSNV